MTEKEKMLSGFLYNSGNPDLIKDRMIAKDLCYEFNNTKPSDKDEQEKIIRKLFGGTKEIFNIEAPFFCDYGYNISIGDNFFVNHNTVILDCASVNIGNNVFIGPNCGIYTVNHPLDKDTRNEGLEYAHSIDIGDNVWIGGGVTILPGVTIGDNSVIASGSVVNKDIPNNVLAAGVPCKVIKRID